MSPLTKGNLVSKSEFSIDSSALQVKEMEDVDIDTLSSHELPTPVKFDAMLPDLATFDVGKKNELEFGFKKGFIVHFEGDDSSLDCNNAKSAMENMEAVDKKLSTEIGKGRVGGPSEKPPFDNFKCSPLAIREKSEKGKYRLLHNLSFPYDENSVNFNIPKHESTVHYQTIEDALEIVRKLGKNCFLAKSDISEAFRLLPLNPSQYHLMGFTWRNNYYFDKCLPMGCSSSCRLFESFSDSIVHILKTKYEVEYIIKVLDDFLFLSKSEQKCQAALNAFLDLCSKADIPVAHKKTTLPCNCLVFLGLEIDTAMMEVRLPKDKLCSYAMTIDKVLLQDQITLRDLRSIVGKLQYSTSVVRCGKAFLRRLINMQIGMSKPYALVRITEGARADLDLWKQFLNDYNGRNIISERFPVTSPTINLYSDASQKWGFGATYGSYWIQCLWPESWKKFHITILELFPLLALVVTFGHKMRNSVITFHCDNQAVVEIVNKQSSKDLHVMNILRPLILKMLLLNITFRAVHIPGVTNILADRLSRFQDVTSLLKEHSMAPSPTPLPVEVDPSSFRI